jgi:hypothetical protein
MDSQNAGCFLDRPPFIWVWAPFYRSVFTPYIRPVLRGVFGYPAVEMRQLRGEMAQVHARMDQLSAELRRIPEKMESVHLNSLGQWDMMERSVMSSLHVMDQNVSRQVYHLEQVRTLCAELLKKLPESAADQNKPLEDLLNDRFHTLLEEIQLQAAEREAVWKEVEQLLLSLVVQPTVRVQANLNPANHLVMKASSE